MKYDLVGFSHKLKKVTFVLFNYFVCLIILIILLSFFYWSHIKVIIRLIQNINFCGKIKKRKTSIFLERREYDLIYGF